MRIRFIAATLNYAIFSTFCFSAIENVDDTYKCSFLRDTQELFQAVNPVDECKKDGKKAMRVYRSALAILNDTSPVLNEARAEKEYQILRYEQKIDGLNEEIEGIYRSIKMINQILPVIENAHFGVIMGKVHDSIEFGSNLFVPKEAVQLDTYIVLTGENDRDLTKYRSQCAAMYKVFSLTNEERKMAGENYAAFIESFKINRRADYASWLESEKRKLEQLSTNVSHLTRNKAQIIQQIQDDIDAKIRSRNDMYDLTQIESLKWAFQGYGNALNGARNVSSEEFEKQQGEIIRLKEEIDDLLPTLSEKTRMWLDNLYPKYKWTVVTKKKKKVVR